MNPDRLATIDESYLVAESPATPLHVASIANRSYDGALNLCITADRTACPDAKVFATGIAHGFTALHATWEPALA